MNLENEKNPNAEESRPVFPKRAVITAGMPYGNKELHFGHIGGVFVHADMFARFLRDRIGKENVMFISGTDCYGSPIVANYMQLVRDGEFSGTIEEFVTKNHQKHKEVLDAYQIAIDLFAASGLGRAAEIHRLVSEEVIQKLYENGHLIKMTTSQFYDSEHEVFLNGRQVVGQCPIEGCASDKGYADECALGHQYQPIELINPRSILSGKKPEMRDVVNWYVDLEKFYPLLKQWVESLKEQPNSRPFMIKSIEEFLEPPVIYIKREFIEQVKSFEDLLPPHTLTDDEKKSSETMTFQNLEEREKACVILSERGVRFRTGKTLVPFRLTGNVEWGVPAPALEGSAGLTIWVWPESLWAPVSFTKTALEKKNGGDWKDWWCSSDAKVYQFIGQDNVYFYGPAEMAMFMGLQGENPSFPPQEGQMQIPELIVNNHILFLNKKASSSGEVKPPMAGDLLEFYMPEQLRAHFLGLGLGIRSVSFQPKPLNPKANETDSDPVLKEGNLLTNVFNRAVRSCFYTSQKYYYGEIPYGQVSEEILQESRKTVLEVERLIYRYEFHLVMNALDIYIRNLNKYWVKYIRQAEEENNDTLRRQVLIDCFHMVRTAAVLMHPIAPEGTEMIRDFMNMDESFWSWDKIFEPVYAFMQPGHKLKFLEARVDFFKKHPSQF
jgi:methionyl-tRNA synthetase